ncbi:NADP-dependent 3-hydroxy acid dehydrogenase YdfG [Lentzea xinjiangensis]|uniref:NADP-dependent 3-hydroxy acid dehydrogenase YdfG n=1 Tax=Lentzea xinjiangensis TaxID=402600 RepID=A0A1H9WPD0_9PSEU|nr:oxidoreductase [Lentzea xinjiangensis]SES35674.1 NADP-dependent 3-hydroxy acid dehydrogenase YdfG [Lentzea xinjiangensis]
MATWFITGCSTGFGRHIAEHLLDTGHRVVATARNTAKIADLASQGEVLPLELDVTNPAQVRSAVARAEEEFGGIDVLVNNAGSGYFAAVEESEPDAVRRMFDVNFFAAADVITAVLPGMRRRRSGVIVNLTSIGGLEGFESVGHYCASKFALEGLSDALRKEVAPLGIGVMTVEPSAFRTEWAGSAAEPAEVIDDYAPTAGAARQAYRDSIGKQAGDPALAARALVRAVESPTPPQRLLLGNEAYDTALAKLDRMRAEFTAQESTARGVDAPA